MLRLNFCLLNYLQKEFFYSLCSRLIAKPNKFSNMIKEKTSLKWTQKQIRIFKK